VILWTFLATFYDIFTSQIVGKFPWNFSGKVPLFFWKFPEKFRRKFPEISQLTTLVTAVNGTPSHSYRESLIIWHKWTMVMMMMIC